MLWLQEKPYQYRCSPSMHSTPICIIPNELLIVGHLQKLSHAHPTWAGCKVFFVFTWWSLRGIISSDEPSRIPHNILWLIGIHNSTVKMPTLGEVPNIPCLYIICGSGHHQHHWTSGGGSDFPQDHIFWQDCNHLSTAPQPLLNWAETTTPINRSHVISCDFKPVFCIRCMYCNLSIKFKLWLKSLLQGIYVGLTSPASLPSSQHSLLKIIPKKHHVITAEWP